MIRLYIRNYFVVAAVGMFCLLITSVVSAQNATDLNCDRCVGRGEVANNTVGWFNLDGAARAFLINQANDVDGFDARLSALEAAIAATTPPTDLTDKTYCLLGQGTWLSAGNGTASVTANPYKARLDFTSSTQLTSTGVYDPVSTINLPAYTMVDEPDPSVPEMGTYTVVGNRLSLTFLDEGESETADLILSPDGRVIIFGAFERSEDAGVEFWETEILVGVQAAGCS